MMPTKFFLVALSFILLGFNPKGCKALLEGCSSTASRSADDVPPPRLPHETPETPHSGSPGEFRVESPPVHPEEEPHTNQAEGVLYTHSDNSYHYNGVRYTSLSDIPLSSGNRVAVEGSLTRDQADALLHRGVRFVYSATDVGYQLDKPFQIILAMSEDIREVKALYQLASNEQAEKLVGWSSEIGNNPKVWRAGTLERIKAFEAMAVTEGKVPIIVFHNNSDWLTVSPQYGLQNASHVITCNSFASSPNAYLQSTCFIDMEATLRALGESLENEKTGEFYEQFIGNYNNAFSEVRQRETLLWVGRGSLVVGGIGTGIYAITYFHDKK